MTPEQSNPETAMLCDLSGSGIYLSVVGQHFHLGWLDVRLDMVQSDARGCLLFQQGRLIADGIWVCTTTRARGCERHGR